MILKSAGVLVEMKYACIYACVCVYPYTHKHVFNVHFYIKLEYGGIIK